MAFALVQAVSLVVAVPYDAMEAAWVALDFLARAPRRPQPPCSAPSRPALPPTDLAAARFIAACSTSVFRSLSGPAPTTLPKRYLNET